MAEPALEPPVTPKPSLQGRGIAITRPVGQADKLSELITAHGGHVILFPLIAIAPLADYTAFERMLAAVESCDYAIFISSNAVHNAMPRLLAKLGNLPENLKFAAIGPVTAGELAKFGVKYTLTAENRFDSESLLALPEMHDVAGKKIMIFRGVGGREVLADTLQVRGAQVKFAECYRRLNPQTDAGVLPALWQNSQLHVIVVTSSEAMRHLFDISANGTAEWLRDVVLCVNHARIAELPQQTGLRVAIAQAPGDQAMLQCLIDTLNHHD